MLQRYMQGRAGFTIVELLIVVVVIAVLAVVTIVAYNGIANQAKSASMATVLGQWKKKSLVHQANTGFAQCPVNYVFVYGNTALGTSDFCVMKYEAKIQGNDNGATNYSSAMVAESRPTGTPWVRLSHTDATVEASAACEGCHLITEAEWMTIAADVLSVKYNWSGGEVGSGFIYQGHTNDNPAAALAASADDTDTLALMTGGFGDSVGSNTSRVLYLKSGDAIWDFSANVWEWTAQSQALYQIGLSSLTTESWMNWNQSGLSFGNLPSVSRPSALSGQPELSSITTWYGSKGIGQLYTLYSDTSLRAFRRGGAWGGLGASGVIALNTFTSPSNLSNNIGFRVVRP